MSTAACPRPLASPRPLGPLLRLLRPHQWTKNGICLAGVIFSDRFTEPWAWATATATLLIFCLASSAAYVLNDIVDRDRDRTHSKKRLRPIASGALSVGLAAACGLLLGAAAALGAAFQGWQAVVCVLAFLANNVAYSLWLKHLALWDVLSITLGFLLRLAAGVYVLGELPTTWIVLCSFFLAAFLGFSKRRAELGTVPAHERCRRRPVLLKYSPERLDRLIRGAAWMAVVCYALFATASGKTPLLAATLPVVYYAIMHYQQQVLTCRVGEEPESMLWTDRRIAACVVVWLVMYLGICQAVAAMPGVDGTPRSG